jgi:hypothetical protein
MTLDGEDVEAIARRVAELLRGNSSANQYVDASTIARRFGVTRAWVYQHKSELGAMPLGSGPKPRLRFDMTRVGQVLAREDDHAREDERSAPRRRGRSRTSRPARTPTGLPVLEYEGM